LSPGQKQRVEEKQELQNLNSRLAAYIDRVRTLQEENGRLMVQVRSKEETVTREVVAVKETYEKELTDVKALLDDATKEKAALQVEKRNLRASNEDLKEK
jgi:lamin B